MRAEIITIGDELLIGQTINTNASWMAERLESNGVSVQKITTISDKKEAISEAIFSALSSSELVLMTGGLGPTNDDITKAVLCDFFGDELRLDPKVLTHIKELFARYRRRMNAWNERQALVPASCLVLPNENGTAPGMCFEQEGKLLIAMPGVPFEMKALMQQQVLPLLKERGVLLEIIHKTVVIRGIVESHLAELLEEWEQALPSGIRLAYLPSRGVVRLRFTGIGVDRVRIEHLIQNAIARLKDVAGSYFCPFQVLSLEQYVGELLKLQGVTVATAESCTGGSIAKRLVAVAGSSAYYKGSVVAYTEKVKEELLAVPKELIKEYGIVSEAVVKSMAVGVQEKMQVDYALATSGVAGPTGGTKNVPVGTVCLALATPDEVHTTTLLLDSDRNANIEKATVKALELLKEALENK